MKNSSSSDDQMKIGASKVGSSTALAPIGSLTYQNCEELKAKFDELINQYKTKIILNLKDVPFLDSEALTLMLQTHDELRRRGGGLKIVGLNAVCSDILTATRLINVLYVYEDIHEAVTSSP